jgi:hypothetical protein
MSLVDALDLILETEASRRELGICSIASLRATCKSAKHSVDSVRMEVVDTTEYIVRKLPPSLSHQPISTLRSLSFMIPINEEDNPKTKRPYNWLSIGNYAWEVIHESIPTIIMHPGVYSSLESLKIVLRKMDDPNADVVVSGENSFNERQYIILPEESYFPALKKVHILEDESCSDMEYPCHGLVDVLKHFGFVHTLKLENCFLVRNLVGVVPQVKRLEVNGRTDIFDIDWEDGLDCPCLEELVVHVDRLYNNGCLEMQSFFLDPYKNLRVIDLQNVFLNISDFDAPEWSQSLEVLRVCNAPLHIDTLKSLCDLHFPKLHTVDFSGVMFMSECPVSVEGYYLCDEDIVSMPRNEAMEYVFDACRTGRWPQCDLSL